jgi:hypothetical protein
MKMDELGGKLLLRELVRGLGMTIPF